MKRVVVVVGLLLGLAVAGFVTIRLATAERHRINDESFKKIVVGMTLEEVESIFGVPAGDYNTSRVLILGHDQSGDERWINKNPAHIWMSNNGIYWIYFDDAGRVAAMEYGFPFIEVKESWLEKLRHWLGLK